MPIRSSSTPVDSQPASICGLKPPKESITRLQLAATTNADDENQPATSEIRPGHAIEIQQTFTALVSCICGLTIANKHLDVLWFVFDLQKCTSNTWLAARPITPFAPVVADSFQFSSPTASVVWHLVESMSSCRLLRRRFNGMKTAIRSWGKYVPWLPGCKAQS